MHDNNSPEPMPDENDALRLWRLLVQEHFNLQDPTTVAAPLHPELRRRGSSGLIRLLEMDRDVQEATLSNVPQIENRVIQLRDMMLRRRTLLNKVLRDITKSYVYKKYPNSSALRETEYFQLYKQLDQGPISNKAGYQMTSSGSYVREPAPATAEDAMNPKETRRHRDPGRESQHPTKVTKRMKASAVHEELPSHGAMQATRVQDEILANEQHQPTMEPFRETPNDVSMEQVSQSLSPAGEEFTPTTDGSQSSRSGCRSLSPQPQTSTRSASRMKLATGPQVSLNATQVNSSQSEGSVHVPKKSKFKVVNHRPSSHADVAVQSTRIEKRTPLPSATDPRQRNPVISKESGRKSGYSRRASTSSTSSTDDSSTASPEYYAAQVQAATQIASARHQSPSPGPQRAETPAKAVKKRPSCEVDEERARQIETQGQVNPRPCEPCQKMKVRTTEVGQLGKLNGCVIAEGFDRCNNCTRGHKGALECNCISDEDRARREEKREQTRRNNRQKAGRSQQSTG